MPYVIVFSVALVLGVVLSPVAARLAWRWGAVAEPGGRRRHRGPIPRLGGIPILGAFLVAALLGYGLLPPTDPNDALRLRGVLLGGVVVFIGGLIDDRWELPAWAQFLIQLAGAAVAIGHIIFIEVFSNPLITTPGVDPRVWIPRPLAILITLFWMVGMINTVNFLDGLDGLAVGVAAIAALLFAWHSTILALTTAQTTVALFPLALAGALLGFLPFNFAPARLFLGTAGAYFLGYTLATLSILAPAKIATALLVMAVPILDVAWQIVDRLRRGQSPFTGDRGHLHFRLSDGGLPTRRIVLGYYGVATAFGLVAIFATGLIKLVMLVVLSVAVFLFLIKLSVVRVKREIPK